MGSKETGRKTGSASGTALEPTNQASEHSWSIARIPIFRLSQAQRHSHRGTRLTKLQIGAVDDPLEREADRAAARVMGKSRRTGLSSAP
jgi:hypothetical protein